MFKASHVNFSDEIRYFCFPYELSLFGQIYIISANRKLSNPYERKFLCTTLDTCFSETVSVYAALPRPNNIALTHEMVDTLLLQPAREVINFDLLTDN